MKIFLLALLYSFSLLVNAQKIISGPMIGNVELRTATIWTEVSSQVKKVSVQFKKTGDAKLFTEKYTGVLGKEFNPIKIDLTNLEMNTTYQYSLVIDGKITDRDFKNSFSTKILWQHRTPAPDFSFITGSCAYFNEPVFDRPGKPYGWDSSIFLSMAKERAAFALWLGDNWYTRESDYLSFWGLQYRASRDRSMKVLQPFLAAMPQYAIWDDHDYGPNDANKSYIFKQQSRELFMNYTCNPSYGEEGKGIYTKVSFADVDIFLMDDRFFRSSDKMMDSINGLPNTEKTFFGSMQLTWLKNALLYSNATFKIIACGSQVINPVSNYECMRKYTSEYNELMQFLQQQKINGVLFLTGDRHHSEIIRLERANNYPLIDITVSPFTAGVGKASGAEANNPYREPNTLIEQQNYGKVSVLGDKGSRIFKIEFMNLAGNKITEWQISESVLKAPKN